MRLTLKPGIKLLPSKRRKSQYILGAMLSSGNLNYEPIYKQIHEAMAHSIIAYNRRREPEMEGFDENFAPTWLGNTPIVTIATMRSTRLSNMFGSKNAKAATSTRFTLPEGLQDEKNDGPSKLCCIGPRIHSLEKRSQRNDPQSKEWMLSKGILPVKQRETSNWPQSKAHFDLVRIVYNCMK